MTKYSLRNFDPISVAKLETDMWRAYYDHKFIKLFLILLNLFKHQFGTTGIVNLRLAYYSGNAAKIFRKYGDKNDTLKNLEAFYGILQKHSLESFDKTLVAKSELNWWISHRYPKKGSLEHALAESMAILYSVPPNTLLTYGELRAQAMELRDVAAHKGKTEPNWSGIQDCLGQSYKALSKAVTTN